MYPDGKPIYEFGPFRLDAQERILYQNDQRVPLAPKALDTLIVLLENHGRIVEKDELMRRVWTDAFVEEGNLTVNIFLLRKVLSKGLNGASCIETIPKRGYRFVARLQEASPPAEAGPTTTGIAGLPGAFPLAPNSNCQPAQTVSGTNSALPETRATEPAAPRTPEPILSARLARASPRIALAAAAAALVAVLAWIFLHQHPRPVAELTQKRLTFNSTDSAVESGAISPDGKYLAYSDPAGVHVRLLSTGDQRVIPRPTGIPADADWGVQSWFPDGTQLLADARDARGHESMWAVPVLGQSPRELHEGAAAGQVSPDGRRIAFTPHVGTLNGSGIGTSEPYGHEVWVMGSQGSEAKQVFALGDNEGLWSLHWSPDGRRLAYLSRAFHKYANVLVIANKASLVAWYWDRGLCHAESKSL